MADVIVRGSTIKLIPGPGWEWERWDGVVTLNQAPHSIAAGGSEVVLEPDIIAAVAQQSTGKSYTAMGFADTPGMSGPVVATLPRAHSS